ncbi:hypothetical protein LTR37_014978 [Vermiconidia calcicola]|uniref:Uncharacterized protein n=1 Tax=Vermiconidia calcicola TaxID=1690605 RepID=A0ACC3MUT4_9PEZI|nr:hypothetical protein LTR37_014978 [Vermiconidia calcicola]
MRVAEIMDDFRNIQNYIASIRASPSAEEYNEQGFVLLRCCVREAQILLSQPFQQPKCAKGDDDQIRTHLRRIVTDAAVRRFKAQRIYLRATAALRWINSRAAVLQGQRAHAGHAAALQQVRNTLRSELSSITDQRIELLLRTADANAGKWLAEDPGLQVLQGLAGNGNGNACS